MHNTKQVRYGSILNPPQFRNTKFETHKFYHNALKRIRLLWFSTDYVNVKHYKYWQNFLRNRWLKFLKIVAVHKFVLLGMVSV